MSENSHAALICPSCRTRLRVTSQQAGSAFACPECRQPLIASDDLHSVSIVTQPQAAPAMSVTRRRSAIIIAAVTMLLLVIALRPSSRTIEQPVASTAATHVEQPANSDAQPARSEAAPKTAETAPNQIAAPLVAQPVAPVAPQVSIVAVGVQEKLPSVRATPQPTDAPPPEPEARSVAAVQDPAVIPVNAEQLAPVAAPKPPSPQELIEAALAQRFVSFSVPSKTTLRSLVRELNELANGFIVLSPDITTGVLNKPVSITLKDSNLRDVLTAVAQATGLQLVVTADRIELQPK